jgi:hypothetical protein
MAYLLRLFDDYVLECNKNMVFTQLVNKSKRKYLPFANVVIYITDF